MNIFALDEKPDAAAKLMVDSHVVKMILESAQLLSTAHRLWDGVEYIGTSKSGRSAKRWRLPDAREQVLYSATHINHPSARWCRETSGNYNWLYRHFRALLDEYTYRYGKHHKCEALDLALYATPFNIPIAYQTPFACAMDDSYIISHDPVVNYRNYYKHGKVHLHKWTKRNQPGWIKD